MWPLCYVPAMSGEQRHVTMADVAERAGVSVSTVSRTLRGLAVVNPETRARVEQAAEELSFAISRSASSLVTGRTRRIAVLVPQMQSWFPGAALTGISEVLRQSDLDLLVYSVTTMRERSEFFDHLPARRNADALMVVSFNLTLRERARLDELRMPVVLVSQHAQGRASVYIDDIEGACRGTRHLANLGHRRIAFIQTADPSGFAWSSRDRLIGYRRALQEAGLPYDDDLVVRVAPGCRRSLVEAVGHLLSLPGQPTAIFSEADDIAAKVLGVLRAQRVDVPGRISVLGFDDQELAEWLDLTTVAQPAVAVGRTAAELVASIVDDPHADAARHIVLPTRLIPRGSTAPPPASSGNHHLDRGHNPAADC
jgi:DNA-binding LacI/PurR family transcriptional regulator